jgi:hypothetical protein
MNYQKLIEVCPDFCNRYSPKIDSLDNIVIAIKNIHNDKNLTQVELIAFQKYAQFRLAEYYNNYGKPYVFNYDNIAWNYNWCNTCVKMMGNVHVHCSSCHESHFSTRNLRSCGRCGRCCSHSGCQTCGGCHGHTCGVCECCRPHCRCVRPEFRRLFGDFPSRKPGVDMDKIFNKEFKSERLAGVEWEFNSCQNNSLIDQWVRKWKGSNIHGDGSCGSEAVTAPLAGDLLCNSLRELGNAFSEGRSSIDTRCGIHVHVDARDLKWTDIYRFLSMYGQVEPFLYLLAGQERVKSTYARPCGNDYLNALNQIDLKNAIMTVAYGNKDGRNYQRHKPSKKDGGRYRSVNLVPWLVGRRKQQVKKDTTI